MNKIILSIETSCDETAAAVVAGTGKSPVRVRSSIIASQIKLHARFGGVFPDLAAREHTKNIIPTIQLALFEAGLTKSPKATPSQLIKAFAKIDALGVTVGPGLIGSLLIGTTAAAQLALLLKKPIIPINHWEGHLYSVFLENTIQIPRYKTQVTKKFQVASSKIPMVSGDLKTKFSRLPRFPVLFLTVSGGHTSLILMTDHFRYQILGETLDDAAGEAFDKIARMLDLGFPGGPAISYLAAQARENNQTLGFKFPRPMIEKDTLNFSFSGLKTAVLYALQKQQIRLPQDKAAAAREAEEAIVEVLVTKTLKAALIYQPKSIAIVGGVSANNFLRQELIRTRHLSGVTCQVFLPNLFYTTDNAAMIGAAALFRLAKHKGVGSYRNIKANASLRL